MPSSSDRAGAAPNGRGRRRPSPESDARCCAGADQDRTLLADQSETPLDISRATRLSAFLAADPAHPRQLDRWVERARSVARPSSRRARFGDPIDALIVYLLGNEIEVELLLDHACEEAADRMLLPVGRLHDRSDRGALGFVQHLQD